MRVLFPLHRILEQNKVSGGHRELVDQQHEQQEDQAKPTVELPGCDSGNRCDDETSSLRESAVEIESTSSAQLPVPPCTVNPVSSTRTSPICRKRVFPAFPDNDTLPDSDAKSISAQPSPLKRSHFADSKPAARTRATMAGPRKQYLSYESREDDIDPAMDPLENEAPPLNESYPIGVMSSGAWMPNSSTMARVVTSKPTRDDEAFSQALKSRGLEIIEQAGDGNCLFRAVSIQVYGDSQMYDQVRSRCLDFMAADPEHFSPFVTGEAFHAYIDRKRQDGVHGNNPELQAISELYNRPVEVFTPDTGAKPLNIFHAEYKTGDTPIRLSYHDGNHYNAVIDPLVPTAGLGLGLPGLQPGLADKMQVAKAMAESDQMADDMELQRVLKESKEDQIQRAFKETSYSMEHKYQDKAIALSDLDATNFEIEQTMLEHSLETNAQREQGCKQRAVHGRRWRKRSSLPVSPFLCPPNAASLLASQEEDAATPKSTPPVAAAAASSATAGVHTEGSPVRHIDEYPQAVQELVMNGFELRRVIHAYELLGDNFDDLLAFLMSRVAS
jgi:hypothetical protein